MCTSLDWVPGIFYKQNTLGLCLLEAFSLQDWEAVVNRYMVKKNVGEELFKHPIMEVFEPESKNSTVDLEGKRKLLIKLKVTHMSSICLYSRTLFFSKEQIE